jgi:hypothetical protein
MRYTRPRDYAGVRSIISCARALSGRTYSRVAARCRSSAVGRKHTTAVTSANAEGVSPSSDGAESFWAKIEDKYRSLDQRHHRVGVVGVTHVPVPRQEGLRRLLHFEGVRHTPGRASRRCHQSLLPGSVDELRKRSALRHVERNRSEFIPLPNSRRHSNRFRSRSPP